MTFGCLQAHFFSLKEILEVNGLISEAGSFAYEAALPSLKYVLIKATSECAVTAESH